MYTIGLHPIVLRVDLHFWHRIVEFHILLTDVSTVLDRFHSTLQTVGCNVTRSYGGFGYEED